MNFFHYSLLPFVTMSVMLSSCANETSNRKGSSSAAQDGVKANEQTPPPSVAYASETERPVCDDSRKDQFVFIVSLKQMQVCKTGKWEGVDIKGEKGDTGATGATGEKGKDLTEAENIGRSTDIYKKFRRSTFRLSITCSENSSGKNGYVFGSGFRCSETQVCTNAHVVQCPTNYTFRSIKFEAVSENVDTVGSADKTNKTDGLTLPGFFTTTTPTIKKATGRDLAKVTASNFPADAAVVPIPTTDWKSTVQILDNVVSMSFPLAFQDLYVDVGRVNVPVLTECYGAGTNGGYGCLKADYDFSTTNGTDHGSSGSPLFHVKTGQLIGVTSAGPDGENANYTFAIDAFEYSKF